MTTNLVGDLPRYGEMWYSPHAIANILFLNKVKQKYRVKYGSNNGDNFIVYDVGGLTHNREFVNSKIGLYYHKVDPKFSDHDSFTFINIVANNATNFSKQQIERAKYARKVQNIIGFSTLRNYLHIIDNNMIRNFPVTRTDVQNAEIIFGKNLGSLKGNSHRITPKQITVHESPLLNEIIRPHRKIILSIDVMTVNKIKFLVTISRNIKFSTVGVLKNGKDLQVYDGITKVVQI